MKHTYSTNNIETICKKCATISTVQIPKSRTQKLCTTTIGFCYKCKEKTEHYIIGDKDLVYNMLQNKFELTEDEKETLSLLNKNIQNNSKVKGLK